MKSKPERDKIDGALTVLVDNLPVSSKHHMEVLLHIEALMDPFNEVCNED